LPLEGRRPDDGHDRIVHGVEVGGSVQFRAHAPPGRVPDVLFGLSHAHTRREGAGQYPAPFRFATMRLEIGLEPNARVSTTALASFRGRPKPEPGTHKHGRIVERTGVPATLPACRVYGFRARRSAPPRNDADTGRPTA